MKINEIDELQEYMDILSDKDYPEFLGKYLNTESMQRLKGVGQFCGIDYNRIPSNDVKYWYSKYDHSIATALIVWHITKDKKQTIIALIHNVGTPIFSHCVDYMLGDTEGQTKSKKILLDMILRDEKLCSILKRDEITREDILDMSNYTILENEAPKLSADRLEGIFVTNLLLTKIWGLKEIKEIYSAIQQGINEEKNKELAFNNLKMAEEFFEGVYRYTFILEQNEEKLTMQLIADTLKESIDNGIITEKNLYKLTEKEYIDILLHHEKSKALQMWDEITKMTFIGRSDIPKPMFKCYSINGKKRYVNPLLWSNGEYKRAKTVSKYIESRLNNILFLKDSKYCYIVDQY